VHVPVLVVHAQMIPFLSPPQHHHHVLSHGQLARESGSRISNPGKQPNPTFKYASYISIPAARKHPHEIGHAKQLVATATEKDWWAVFSILISTSAAKQLMLDIE